MIRTTVELEPEIVDALDDLSRQQGKSREDLIQEVITQFAREGGRPMPQGMGAYQSNHADIGCRAEDILKKAARDGQWQ
jgi:metal-responsive CopG/Arc/MetJ family transcriptional regulator